MRKTLFSLLGVVLVGKLAAQSPLIFQPGPGANDSTDQGGVNGGKDTWCFQNQPATNYGGDMNAIAYPISDCNQTHAVSFFQFDVNGLPFQPDSVFVGFTFFDHTSYCYSNCVADFYFAYVAGPWHENTINYNNFPLQGSDFFGPVHIEFPNAFGTKEFDITQAYDVWRSGNTPNNGFIVYSPTIGCNNAAVNFNVHTSDDTIEAKRPYLKIYGGSNAVQDTETVAEVEFYPNPSRSILEIRSNAMFKRVCLFNQTGNMVQSRDFNGELKVGLDISTLPNGIYHASVETRKGLVTQRVVVIHD